MTVQKGFDQHDQKVSRNQTNIDEANAPVFAGDVGVVNIFPKEKTPISRLPFIPDPPPNFAGRYEELKELLAQFDAGKTIIALYGFGGVGKTALSLKLVESIKDNYPDGQIIVDMRGTTDPISRMEAMGSVIRSYHREEKIPDSEAETRKRYLEVLKDKRALLLLDNALDDKQVLRLVPPKGCGLIITSRRIITIPNPFFFKMDLDVLKPGEALELLLSVCCPAAGPQKSTRDDPAWHEIARLCGFLPLALLAAASYLANSENVSPREYAKALTDERSRLEMIGEQGVDMSVDASLGLSFQRLEPKLQQTFLDLSAFPADFDSQAEEQICLDQGHRSLNELLRWSLVDYKAQGQDYGRYKLHDLARIFALVRQKEEKKAAVSQRHASHYKDLLSAADNFYLQGGEGIQKGLALFDREEANIMAGHNWSCKSLEASSQAAELCMDYPEAGANILQLRCPPSKRIRCLLIALKTSRQLNDRFRETNHLLNLGRTSIDLSSYLQAIDYLKQALYIAHEFGNIPAESKALDSLGMACIYNEDYNQAIAFLNQAIKITREIGDKHLEASALGHLGAAYYYLSDFYKSIEFHEQSQKIASYIGDLRRQGFSLANIGEAYCEIDKLVLGIESCEKALVISRKIGDKRLESYSLVTLSEIYNKLEKHSRAVELSERALATAREIGERRAEADALGNLGKGCLNLGNICKAIECHEQKFAITQDIPYPKGGVIALCSLATCHKNLGDSHKAIDYSEQALKISKDIEYPKGVAEALFAKAQALHQLGQHEEAIKCAQKALAIFQRIESPVAEQVRQQLEQWQG